MKERERVNLDDRKMLSGFAVIVGVLPSPMVREMTFRFSVLFFFFFYDHNVIHSLVIDFELTLKRDKSLLT
ncbi:hypothetical protein BDF14DRAFT_1832958 [Spinellus fusiger]|nr:hypothetical protein BDF14DRAFT_1832958 [Spinellus fusiger]